MLSDQISALRRAKGLSQEQLAEQVGVSRQAVSKWETGQAIPELPKLLALSACLGVSLDELTGGTEHRNEGPAPSCPPPPAPSPRQSRGRAAGLVLCLVGGILLLLTGILLLLFPETAGRVDASSTVTLNGSGVLLVLCAAVMTVGLLLLFWKK